MTASGRQSTRSHWPTLNQHLRPAESAERVWNTPLWSQLSQNFQRLQTPPASVSISWISACVMSGSFLFSLSLLEISFSTQPVLVLVSFGRTSWSIKSRRFAGLISRGVARSSSLVFCRDRCIARASVSHSVIDLASTFCCKFRIDRDLFNSSCFSSLVRPLFSTRESGGFQHLITPIRDPVHCLKTPGPSDVLSRRKVALTEFWSVKDDGWCLWKQEVTMLIRPGESNMKSILPCCLPIM